MIQGPAAKKVSTAEGNTEGNTRATAPADSSEMIAVCGAGVSSPHRRDRQARGRSSRPDRPGPRARAAGGAGVRPRAGHDPPRRPWPRRCHRRPCGRLPQARRRLGLPASSQTSLRPDPLHGLAARSRAICQTVLRSDLRGRSRAPARTCHERNLAVRSYGTPPARAARPAAVAAAATSRRPRCGSSGHRRLRATAGR